MLGDSATRSAALDAGEVLLAGPNPVPYSELDRFRGNPQFTVELRGEELLMHVQALQFNLRHTELKKPEVRQAIYHAIDRKALIRSASGTAQATLQIVPFRFRRAVCTPTIFLHTPYDPPLSSGTSRSLPACQRNPMVPASSSGLINPARSGESPDRSIHPPITASGGSRRRNQILRPRHLYSSDLQ